MNYEVFESIIDRRMSYFVIGGSIVIGLAIICLIYLFKNMRQQKAEFFLLVFLCIGVIIGDCILVGRVIWESNYDTSNCAYVEYTGEFIVDTNIETRSGTCSLYIPNKDGVKLETDAYILDSGTHFGTIVYGEKTKIVLSIVGQ